MQNNQLREFHHFIEISAHKTKQSQNFPEFQYMEQTIRKNYKQLKKTKTDKTIRPCERFTEYFKNLEKQQQIRYYQKSIKLLEISLKREISSQQRKQQKQKLKKQGQAYIKKAIINKWQKKMIRLQDFNFCICEAKKQRVCPLKYYAIRKSKNKEHYGLVLQVINQRTHKKLKNIHCGVRNIKDFEEWFQLIDRAIDCAKVQVYRAQCLGLTAQQEAPRRESKIFDQMAMKTLTELAIDNQMKMVQDIDDMVDARFQEEGRAQQFQKSLLGHPNVFKRLFSQVDLNNFTQNGLALSLIENGAGYRLFQMHPCPGQDFRLRINIMLPFNKSFVFKALNQEINLWNNEIDVFSVKTKISTENSALIYQKDRSQGLLYRQRDYLFIRHCFSIKPTNSSQKNKIFIADKSIDSISFPPFMTVARGDKKLIYCIYGNQDDKESMLIVEGLIKGGGYMNTGNDKEMTIKFFKKLLGLQCYLKEKKFIHGDQKGKEIMFQENWEVQQASEEFFDIDNKQDDSEDQSIQEAPQSKTTEKKAEQKDGKTAADNDQQNRQFDEFIKKTTEQNFQGLQTGQVPINKQEQLTFSELFLYNPPQTGEDKAIIIPEKYLKVKHALLPLQKPKNPCLYPHYKGHHLWKGEWALCPTGGLNYVDQQKMNQQKKVLTFIIKRIGRNILSGKGILNISLPVDIFCRQSNIERLAASFGFAPLFLQKASILQDPKQQLKYIVATANFSSMIYLTMQKPFNPILGQTYQSWIDGCPIYFQQISHHPPVAAYLMIGRGYRISGSLQAKMQISINSGIGINQGIFTVQFDNGRKFYYTTAAGQISGLTYGERKLILTGKTFYWCVQEGLFLELQFNPSSKNRRFFGGSNISANDDSQLHDFCEGTLKKYRKQDLEEFLTPKKGDFRKEMAIPKSSPIIEPLAQLYKVTARWTKYISINGQKMFDMDQNRYYTMKDQQNPLPSHANYREDVVYRRMNNVVLSQEFKQVLQVKQRKDKKSRQIQAKNRK